MNETPRILVVDDDESTRRTLQLIFQHQGYTCQTASDGEKGLGLLGDEVFDIVMLDLRLPDALGVDLIAPIKALRPDASIIIATGFASVDTAIRALDQGASAYVTKPLQMQEVLARIRDLVERQRLVEERRAAERALRESEARFRSVVNNSLIGLMIIDDRRRITYANDEGCRILLREREWLLSVEFSTLLSDRSREMALERYAARQRGESPPNHYLIEFVRGDGELRQGDLMASVIHDADGRPLTVCQILDITEKQRLEERLREAQKMEAIGQLAGGIAHEFNNLLTVINGYAEMLSDQLGVSHPIYPEMQEIVRSGARAAGLTGQLLAFARKQMLRIQPLNINRVIGSVPTLLKGSLPDNVSLSLDLAEGIGNVNADPRQLEQIIMHLAENAVDAMPNGGELRISTAPLAIDRPDRNDVDALSPGQYARICVTDTGCGMTSDVLAHVFEPFFTTKEVGKGTGLGLATVYGIVKQLGGDVEVTSAPGKGTTFTISLPAEPLQRPKSPSAPAKPLVLVVEDDPGVRRLTVRLLSGLGYDTIEAAEAQAALAVCRDCADAIDLVLTDITMPGMAGPDLLLLLREVRSDIKALYMTGYTPDTAAATDTHRDGTPLIHKPFDRSELGKRIGEALGT